MRRTTLLWLVLAAFCGAALFHTSQQVTDGRTRLAQLEQDTRNENETLRVLQAEWSYLNQPDRLEKLSRQYLDLAPLKGRQFTKIEKVADRPAAIAIAIAIAADAVPPAAATQASTSRTLVKPASTPVAPAAAVAAPGLAAQAAGTSSSQTAGTPGWQAAFVSSSQTTGTTPAPTASLAAAPTSQEAPRKASPQKTAAQITAKSAAPVIRIRTAAHPAPSPKRPVTAARTQNTFNLRLPDHDSGQDSGQYAPAEEAPYGYPVPSPAPEEHRDFNDLVRSLGVE